MARTPVTCDVCGSTNVEHRYKVWRRLVGRCYYDPVDDVIDVESGSEELPGAVEDRDFDGRFYLYCYDCDDETTFTPTREE